MKYLSIIAILLSSCISATANTDISLEHNFTTTSIVPSENGQIVMMDCYVPDISKSLNDINKQFENASWRISSIEDTLDLGQSINDLNNFAVTLSSNDKIILRDNGNLNKQSETVILSASNIDDKTFKEVLTSSNLQICLSVNGTSKNSLPNVIHSNLVFHFETSVSKEL